MTRFDLQDDDDDVPDEDDDFDEDDPDRDEDDDDEDSEEDDIETWQVSVPRPIPLNVSLRLTSGIKVPRLARKFQLS